jgi:hypothetical protein
MGSVEMDPGKTLRLDVEMNLAKVTEQAAALKKTLSEVPGTASAGKDDAAHQRDVNEAAALQEQIQKKNADALKKTGVAAEDVQLMLGALAGKAKQGSVEIKGMGKSLGDAARQASDLVTGVSKVTAETDRYKVARARLEKGFGREFDDITKIVRESHKQGSAGERLLAIQEKFNAAVVRRVAIERDLKKFGAKASQYLKEELENAQAKEGFLKAALDLTRKTAEELRKSDERSIEAARKRAEANYSNRMRGLGDAAVADAGAVTSRIRSGVGAEAKAITDRINAVNRMSRITRRSAQFERIEAEATLRVHRATAREKMLSAQLNKALASGNKLLAEKKTQELRAQKAVTAQMRAELDLTRKTIAERKKFLQQGWFARKTQSPGVMGNIARGAQHFGGYAIGAYQRTAGGIATGMRVYWVFLSMFYGLRNALQLAMGPLNLFTGALKALVSAAIGAVRDMINIAGKTETLEKRLTSFAGIGPGITSWIVGEAVGKPFEWTSIGEAFQRAMAMGSPGEGFTKGKLMPVAYDLASSFMTDENHGTILRDAVMAIMQGASGNFQRLIRSFGFRPEQALDAGAVRGAGGRGVSGDPKNLQTNLTAILDMIENRVGGTSDAISNTMTALLSDMEDVRNGLAMAFGDTQLFKDIKGILQGLRGAYIKLRDSGTIEEWFGYLDKSFKELMPLVQEALPYATVGLRTAMYLLGQVGQSLTRMLTPFKGQVGDRVNRVLATIEVAFTHFIQSMEAILPRVLVVFETWIEASFKLARMVGNALLWVTDIFLSLVKKITSGGADATVRGIEKGIQKVRDELFIGKPDKNGKRDASTSVMGVSQKALDEFLTGIKGGYNPEIDDAMKRNAQIAAGIPKAVQQGAESGVQRGLAYANNVQSANGFGEDVGGVGSVGGSYSTGGIGGGYSIGGVGGSLGLSGSSAYITRKQLGAKYGPMYDAIQRMESTSAIGRVRESFEQAHANAFQNATMLEQQLSVARESGDKEATDATQEKLRAEREYIALLEKSISVLDQRTRAIEKSQNAKGSGLFERMAGMIGGGDSDAGEVAAFSASVQEMARRNQQEAAWAAWVERTGSAPLRAKIGALSNLSGTIGSGLRGMGFSPLGYSGNRQPVTGWAGKQYTMEEMLTPAQREDRKQAARRAQEMERVRKAAQPNILDAIAIGLVGVSSGVALKNILDLRTINQMIAEGRIGELAEMYPSGNLRGVESLQGIRTANALNALRGGRSVLGSAPASAAASSIPGLTSAELEGVSAASRPGLLGRAGRYIAGGARNVYDDAMQYPASVVAARSASRNARLVGGGVASVGKGAWGLGKRLWGRIRGAGRVAGVAGTAAMYGDIAENQAALGRAYRDVYGVPGLQSDMGPDDSLSRLISGASGVSSATLRNPLTGGARSVSVVGPSASSKTVTSSDSSGNLNIETVNRYSIPVGAVMNEQQQRDYSSINGALGPG